MIMKTFSFQTAWYGVVSPYAACTTTRPCFFEDGKVTYDIIVILYDLIFHLYWIQSINQQVNETKEITQMHVWEAIRRLFNKKFVIVDENLFLLNSIFRASD